MNGERWNGIFNNYIDEKLLFKGEYKDGKIWNGKGYKFYSNTIEYEIINGNGKIKEYIGFNLVYEGDYKNGEKTGKGKQYIVGTLTYEGGFLNGKKHGKGVEYFKKGSKKIQRGV